MKKIIVLLSVVLLATGCSISRLDNTDISKNVEILLSDQSEVYNVNFDGYKYYVPRGIKFLNKEEYNAILQDRFHNKYYLYVDVISYYHEQENTYTRNKNAYYSEKLNYRGKTGYLEINEVDNKYFIEFVFNYAKMEAYVDLDDLILVIDNMCYMLRTVEFNDKVLESLVGDNVLNYKEENFNLFDTTSSEEDFLDVVDKYEDDGYKEDVHDEDELELVEE